MANEASFIVFEGYRELMDELKAAPSRYRRAVGEAFRVEARKVITRAAVYAPRRTGDLASKTRITVGMNMVTIEWTVAWAGVQEWAVDYLRANRGVAGPAPRGTKTTYREKGHVGEGFHEVHMTGPAPPRFAYKAARELRPSIEQAIEASIVQALAASKWIDAVAV